MAVTKSNGPVLDRILFCAKLDPHCLTGEGATLVCLPAHHSQPFSHSAEAQPSGFSTKLPDYACAIPTHI
jgi:hypothetical protein